MIALACAHTPAGYAEMTLSLLEKIIELNIVEASDDTMGGRCKTCRAASRTAIR